MLNEIRSNSLSLQELRFFSIYLAKINARDTTTRVVRFSLDEFQRIMEFGRLNLSQLKNAVDSLLCKVVGVPTERGGFDRFQLFKECRLDQDDKDEWFIEIDAHDKALPLMFEFKERYFTYELWNALRLKSANQIRMYEILKQFEFVGERTISIQELRELLGIDKDEYPRFNNFRARIIDACQEALATNTDIKFTYEPAGKRGQGGRVNALKFNISHNENHVDQLSLSDFINQKEMGEALANDGLGNESEDDFFAREIYPFMSEACGNEFSSAEVQVIYNLIVKIVPHNPNKNRQLEMYDYLKGKYDELKLRASQKAIKRRFGYIKKIIEVDLNAND